MSNKKFLCIGNRNEKLSCVGCGTCVGVCHKNAITLVSDQKDGVYVPKVDMAKCCSCGFCARSCPGYSSNLNDLNQEIFGKEPEDILIGNYNKCYTGYSIDNNIRYNSSSGGLVTQVLIFALEEGLITGALVTRMSKSAPLTPEPFIARSKQEIMDAMKSKYCPVPANIMLREIINSKENERFAVVGLPCHIRGIRLAERINSALRDKIILHLGLFCHHNANILCTKLFLKKLRIKEDDVSQINYRGEGWPGTFSIEFKDGTKISTNFNNFFLYPSIYLFSQNGCFTCSDALCELADISFGDAWLAEQSRDKVGTSIAIIRNKYGDEILQKACRKGRVKLYHMNHEKEKLIQSQKAALYFKKKNLTARRILVELKGHKNHIDDLPLLPATMSDYLIAIFLISLNNYVSKIHIIQKFIMLLPLKVVWAYHLFFYIIINSRKL